MANSIGNVWSVPTWANQVWATLVWEDSGPAAPGSATTLAVVSSLVVEPTDANIQQAGIGVVHTVTIRA